MNQRPPKIGDLVAVTCGPADGFDYVYQLHSSTETCWGTNYEATIVASSCSEEWLLVGKPYKTTLRDYCGVAELNPSEWGPLLTRTEGYGIGSYLVANAADYPAAAEWAL